MQPDQQLPLFPIPIQIHSATMDNETHYRISRGDDWWQGTRWDCEFMAITLVGETRLKYELSHYLKIFN